jgi:hypothetical protein
LTTIAGKVDAIPEKVAEFEIFSVFTSYFSECTAEPTCALKIVLAEKEKTGTGLSEQMG